MYSDPTFALAAWDRPVSHKESNPELAAMYLAADLYERKGRRGLLRRLWAALFPGRVCLPDLASEGSGNRHFAGTVTVPINRIAGSEDARGAYDRDFRPLRPPGRGRWLSVAAARLRGMPLPPVELIELGGKYYVRDGHNRVSVARALGEEFIEASVTVWECATA